MRRLAGELLHLTMEVDTADAGLLGNHVNAEVGVAQVFVDTLHDTVEKLFVGRLQTDIVYLLLEVVVALVFQAQQSA